MTDKSVPWETRIWLKRLLYWNLMIALFVLIAEGAESLTLLVFMQLKGVKPPVNFVLWVQQLGSLSALALGRSWKQEYDPNLGWTMTPGLRRRGQAIQRSHLRLADESTLWPSDVLLCTDYSEQRGPK